MITNVSAETVSAVEQAARAAEELNSMTENLQNLISQFDLDTNTQKINTLEVNKSFIKENAAKI